MHHFHLCCLCFAIVFPAKETLVDHVGISLCLFCICHALNCSILFWSTALCPSIVFNLVENFCLHFGFCLLSSDFRLMVAAFAAWSVRASKVSILRNPIQAPFDHIFFKRVWRFVVLEEIDRRSGGSALPSKLSSRRSCSSRSSSKPLRSWPPVSCCWNDVSLSWTEMCSVR